MADAVNRLLYELVFRCTKSQEEGPRNYFDVGVIGYGANVGSAWGGALANKSLVSITELADNPLRVDTREKDDGAGGIVKVSFPVWFDAVANNGTPMRTAFEQAHGVLESWIQSHPSSYPPTVINITDAESNSGQDPKQAAEQIRQLQTSDGNALVFNVHLSSSAGQALMFPDTAASLPDQFARELFEISSILPPHVREAAAKEGIGVGEAPRGFVFQADGVELVKFLNIGTVDSGLR